MGYCFCDGFKLHTVRKLIWFAVLLAISLYTYKAKNEFDLALILPVPSLLAIFLGSYEKQKATRREAKKLLQKEGVRLNEKK
jgi:hypothetical protein